MEIPTNVIGLLTVKRRLDKQCSDATENLMRQAEPMEDGSFWDLLASFAKRVQRDDSVESACHNLMVYEVYQQEDEAGAWERVCSFFKRYCFLVRQLSEKCSDMPGLDRSDDGYGDLVDSLPLAGRKVCKGILEGKIVTYEDLSNAFDGHTKKFKSFILDGENYIEMSLECAIKKALAVIVGRKVPQEELSAPAPADPCIMLVGYPSTGFEAIGPFSNPQEASDWSDGCDAEAHLMRLKSP